MAKGGIYGDAGASAQALNNQPIAVGRDWSIQHTDERDIPSGENTKTYVSGKHVGDPVLTKIGKGLTRLQGILGNRPGTYSLQEVRTKLEWQEPTQQEPNDVSAWLGRERGGIDYGYAPSVALAVSARAVQEDGGKGAPVRVAQLWKANVREWAGLLQHGFTQVQYQLFMRHETFGFKQQYLTRGAKSISGSLAAEGPTASRVRIPAIFVPRSIS